MDKKERRENFKMLSIYTGAFLISCMFVYGWFVKYDRLPLFRNDGVQQHLSALVYYGRYLREIVKGVLFEHRLAIPLWDFCLGYGSDVYDTLHYYVIGDPFALLAVFVPQRYMEYLYWALIILRSFTAGICFYMYSVHRGNQKFSSMIGSLNYAFCGYVLYYGVRHPYFVSAMIFLPLIMIGIDKVYEKRKPKWFMLSVAFAAVSNFYFFYILSILMAVYAVFEYFCVFKKFEWNKVGKVFVTFLMYYLVAVMMAAAALIPVIYATLSANRMGNHSNFSLLYEKWEYYVMLFGGFTTNEDALGLIFGFLTFSIPAVILLFLKKRENSILKMGYVVTFLLLSLKITGNVMNGMSYYSLRYCFILSVLVSFTIAKMLPGFVELMQCEKMVLTIISLLYIVICMVMTHFVNLKTSGILGIITTIILVWGLKIIKMQRLRMGIVLLFTVLSIADNAYLFYSTDAGNYILRCCSEKTMDELTTNSQLGMAHALDDDDFYRTEAKHYILNTATAVGVLSTSYYYSLINSNLSKFIESQGNLVSAMGYKLKDCGKRAVLDSLFSVKYYVTDERNENGLPYGFDERVLTQNGYSVYKNCNALPFGFTYDSVITQSEYDAMSMLERQNTLLYAAVVSDEYKTSLDTAAVKKVTYKCEYEKLASTKIRVTDDYILVRKAGAMLKVRVKNVKGGELYVNFEGLSFKGKSPKNGKVSFTVMDKEKRPFNVFLLRNENNSFYSGTKDFCISAGYQENEDAVIILKFNNKGKFYFDDFSFQVQPLQDFEERVDALAENSLENVSFDANRISGDITLPQDKMLCMSIPYSTGWSVYVDGKKSETVQVCTAFTGVELAAGAHKIELRYCTPGLKVGILASVIGIILFVVIICKTRKNSTKIIVE